MAQRNTTPKIRFAGFSGDWEERKLGEEAEIIAGGDVDRRKLTEYGHYPVIANALTNDGIIGYYQDEYRIAAPAVTVTGRGDVGHARARVIHFTPVVRLLSMKSQHDIYFLENAINLHKVVIESTGVPQLTAPQLATYAIYFTSLKEQTCIGQLFSTLDNLISQHQQEHEQTANIKKAMLEKMFPKAGATTPEIRFAGFSGDWEERELFDNISSIIDFRGRTPRKLGLDWSDSGYLALSALNVKDGYIDPSADAHFGDQKLYDKWMSGHELHKGQVLFTTEAPMGNVALVPDDQRYILSQRVIAFNVEPEMITDNFLSTLLRSPRTLNQLLSLSSGGTAKGVSQKSMSELIVWAPKNLDEQKCISDYFSALDRLLSLQQRRLAKLKSIKLALLENMFV